MKFVNKEIFREWLMSVLDEDKADMITKYDTYLDEYLYDVEKSIQNGYTSVEVGSYFTKDHIPALYYFVVEYDEDDNVTVTF